MGWLQPTMARADLADGNKGRSKTIELLSEPAGGGKAGVEKAAATKLIASIHLLTYVKYINN